MPWGYTLAHFLLLGRIYERLGLDQARGCLYGAAPLKESTREYFISLGVPLLNSYGMTESTGPTTVNPEDLIKLETAGTAMFGTDLMIYKPEENGEGEICFRGRNSFMGYLKNEQANREILDEDGYIHSGDIGRVDEDNYLKITGRVKELIITAGGENVAPVPIEEMLKNVCPVVSNAVLIGDDRKYLTMLITLQTEIDMS